MANAVEVPIPPSANNLWRTVMRGGRPRTIRTPEYESWLAVATAKMRVGLTRAEAYPVRVTVEITGGKGWRANRDLGNVDKATEDALKHAEIIVDDSVKYVTEVVLRFRPGAGAAKCVVSVDPV